MRLPRCAATLEVLPPRGSWTCGLCWRAYSEAAVDAGLLPDMQCVFCGTAVGIRHRSPATSLAVPGWPPAPICGQATSSALDNRMDAS